MEQKGESDSYSDQRTACLNCEGELAGRFCADCGQAASIQRYSLKSIGNELYEQFRKIDALTTLRTFWQLTAHPGDFVTSYLSGKRVGYLSPVKYFFYSFVVQVLVGSWLFWITNDHSLDQMSHVEFRVEIVSFVSTAFWGILWALFYRKSELNIVENMMAAVFFVGQTNFFSIIFHTAMLPFLRAGLITDQSVDIYDLATHLAYSFYFSRQLFRERLLLLIPKQLVLSILYFGLIVVIFFSVAVLGGMFGHVK